MCSRHLRNDFTVSNTPARKSIKDEDDKTITEEKVSCKIQNTTNDQGFGYINKGELCQDDTYQEKLLPPDIFKLTRLDKSNLSNPIDTFETTKPSTYRAIKRALVEDDPPSIESTTKRVNLKQSIDNKNEIKKNINLNSYTRSSLWHTKINSRIIYRDAIKKIDIDSNGLFKDSVLEKMVKIIKRRRLLKSSIDLSPTYSNIRKYALEKISSLLNEDTIDLDITITPGMSLSDLRSNCISNNSFFKKLRENCEKIVKDLQLTPDNYLSHVFQWHIIFHLNNSSNSTKIKLHAPKYKNLSKLKELIIDTISKLPNSIICEIEKFDQNNIVNALFSNIHGVLVAKSSIKNLSIFFNYNKNKFVNERFYDNLNSLNDLLEKIGNIVRESCIFHEGVFSPNESTTEQLSKYLLSDMYGISSKFHKKLKLPAKDMSKYQELMDSIRLDHNYTKCPIADTPMKKEPQIPESHPISETCTTPSEIIDIKNEKTEISNSYNNEQTATTSDIKNASKPEQYSITKEFNIKPYRRINLCSTEFRSSIYEDAIKKIDIDSNEIFKNSVLEKIGRYITIRGLTKSSLNLSQTYSNISKYLLNKVSPYISDIMTTTCICITPGLHLSDIKNNCLSNNIFFERLSKRCKKIIESINVIPDDYFLNIIQSNIYFSASERLAVARKRNKRKKFCSEVKLLIMDTIYNLPNKIINELKKFKQSELINGLFLKIHGIYVLKSFIKNLNLFFNSNKLPNNDPIANIDLLNNLLTKLLNQVKTSPMLHKGQIFYPGEYTAKLLSKYLLLDMYEIPFKFNTKLKPQKNIKDDILVSDYEKGSVTNAYNGMKSSLLRKTMLIPQKKSKWSPALITSLNIYELALSMINIDKGNFESYFIDKIKNYNLVKEHISKKGKINIDLSVTYDRIKNYILGTFHLFLKETEEEIKEKVKPTHGMTVDELRLAYISNEKFFYKLRKFCTEVTNRIKNGSDDTLIELMQYYIHLETDIPKVMEMRKKRRIVFINEIKNLLIINISNAPELIVNAIKLIPGSKLVEGCFSHFYDIYVDNESLLKAKSLFDYVPKKIANDHLLIELVNKISLDMINEIGKKNSVGANSMRGIINSYIVCEKLSTYKYIRKLVRVELLALKDKLADPIMIMRNDKIETADKKARNDLLNKLGSNLIEITIKSYNNLCFKSYKSKMGNKN